jgi:hypothetical protein
MTPYRTHIGCGCPGPYRGDLWKVPGPRPRHVRDSPGDHRVGNSSRAYPQAKVPTLAHVYPPRLPGGGCRGSWPADQFAQRSSGDLHLVHGSRVDLPAGVALSSSWRRAVGLYRDLRPARCPDPMATAEPCARCARRCTQRCRVAGVRVRVRADRGFAGIPRGQACDRPDLSVGCTRHQPGCSRLHVGRLRRSTAGGAGTLPGIPGDGSRGRLGLAASGT